MSNEMGSSGVVSSDALDLISSIYDAAVTPDNWPGALELCREFVGGASAAIFAKSVTGNRRQLYHIDGRLDLEQTQVYFSRLAPIDPSNTVQVYAELEQGVITSQKLNPEDFAQSRFASEWAAPQGIVDVGFATIERRGDWAALFGVFRHERDGLGDETMRSRLSLLAPHIGRAVKIGDIIGRANREADTFRNTIDGLAAAVLLVDAEGRLVHANHAGNALIGTGQSVTQNREGTLRLDRQGMRELLPAPGEILPRSASIEMATGERLVVHVLPLASGMRRPSQQKSPTTTALSAGSRGDVAASTALDAPLPRIVPPGRTAALRYRHRPARRTGRAAKSARAIHPDGADASAVQIRRSCPSGPSE